MNLRNLFIVVAFDLALGVACAQSFAAPPVPTLPAHSAASVAAKESARADAIFRAFDTNKDGTLSLQEFEVGYARMQRLNAAEMLLHEQFRLVDADHSGALDAAEYANLVLVKRAGKLAPPLALFDADKNGSLDFAEYVAAIRQLAKLQPIHPLTTKK